MAITPIATKAADPVILSAALYGNKDDLKLISGVGPKLEDLLNKNGVYYFWQVASWDGSDIDFIDERLDVFRGRISRDNWVDQAEQRSQEPGAASAPSR
jgi:predicted flap endonuclease-1-like 5' DNA nuclease